MEQRKTLMEYRNLQKDTYASLVRSVKDKPLMHDVSVKLPSDVDNKTSSVDETTKMEVEAPVEEAPVSSILEVVGKLAARKYRGPASLFSSVVTPVTTATIELKPAPRIAPPKSVSDILNSSSHASSVGVSKRQVEVSLGDDLQNDLINQLILLRVFRRTFGKVALYYLVVREAKMSETLTSEFPEGALVGKFDGADKIELTVESSQPKYFEIKRPFAGKEAELGEAVASLVFSDAVARKKWLYDDELKCFVTEPAVESRGLIEYYAVNYVFPLATKVTFSLGGCAVQGVVEI